MDDFRDELMTRSGTAAFSVLDTHHVIYTVWLFISCSTTGNFFSNTSTPHFSVPNVSYVRNVNIMINCECSQLINIRVILKLGDIDENAYL